MLIIKNIFSIRIILDIFLASNSNILTPIMNFDQKWLMDIFLENMISFSHEETCLHRNDSGELTAKPNRDILIVGHQEATRELWAKLSSRYITYVSALVLEEAGRGDPDQAQMRLAAIAKFPMLDIKDEARHLAEKILAKRGSRLNTRKMLFISR